MLKIEHLEELFKIDENSKIHSGLSMDELSFDDKYDSEMEAYLASVNIGIVKIEKQIDDEAILSHPNFSYNIQIVLIPVGAADTFLVELKRLE